MKYFIVYGDASFIEAKKRIVGEAQNTHLFDSIIAYSSDNLSPQLLASVLMNIKRGGGLWCWKPDIILSTMSHCVDGDIIVYADAGCTIEKSNEWQKFFDVLSDKYEIIASRIYQKNIQWTRREIIRHFDLEDLSWSNDYQFQATVILLKVTSFTRLFVTEWRDIMLSHPEYVMDVPKEQLYLQDRRFIENRHDQAIYSALLYKYLNSKERDKIYTTWEHIEGFDIVRLQAIRATRLRKSQIDKTKTIEVILKTILKQYILYPLISLLYKIKNTK